MQLYVRYFFLVPVLVVFLLANLPVRADPPGQVIKDQASFLPYRKHAALPATVIGVFASETAPVLLNEGRSSAPDVFCFCADGNSYRWVYVPSDNPEITNLQVPVPGPGKVRIYPFLSMARPSTVKHWGVTEPFSLVEVEVNNRDGSPGNDSFVATHVKVIEGTKQYPLKVAEVITRVRKDYSDYCRQQAKEIDRAMTAAQEKALRNQKPTGPREKKDLMFVTWMQGSKELHVRFRTKISDGNFTEVEGGGVDIERPLPLPPPPAKNPVPQPKAVPALPAVPGAVAVFPPPPPPRFKVKVGTAFGIEFGRAYVINKEGHVIRTERLDFESFQNTLQPPPGVGPPVHPLPLPVPPRGDVKKH